MTSNELNRLFRRMLAASFTSGAVLGTHGCAAMVGPLDSASPHDATPGVDAADARPLDVFDVATDRATCPPRVTVTPCSALLAWSCDPPPGIVPGMPVASDVCMRTCPTDTTMGPAFSCTAFTSTAGETTLDCTYCAIGRRTAGLAASHVPDDCSVLARFLAGNATLEAAAVVAFERLRDELAPLGLPAELLERIAQSIEEERDHAARVGVAAEARGVVPARPVFASIEPRSLFDIAVENVTEGCVRETFGALVGHWQAARARDPELRELFAHLADDESRHASLSWELHAWLCERLDAEARRALQNERTRAIRELRSEVQRGVALELVDLAGVPSARDALRLLDQLGTSLWNNAE